MKVRIQKKGSDTMSEVSLADFLLNVGTVSDRGGERTINIGGETYLLDSIEDIQKEQTIQAESPQSNTEPAEAPAAEPASDNQAETPAS